MIVAPLPIRLLIPGFESGKVVVFAMILLAPHAIGLILMTIPFMIIIVFGVMVTPIVLLIVLLVVPAVSLGLQRPRVKL